MNTQTTVVAKGIQELQDRWVQAELQADVATLDTLLDADFVGVGPLGFTLDKQAWLGRHRSGDLKYQALALEDANVRLYGDAAIVIAAQRQKATYQGNEVPGGRFRITLVAVSRDDRWVIAGLHLSPIAQPPGR
jgi:ketosteroid isomerase-like protein